MSISVLNTDAGLGGKTIITAETTQTITAAKTYDLDPNPPFVVTSGSALVTNLDADKLDGQDGSYYQNSTNQTSGTLPAGRLPTEAHQTLSRTVSTVSFNNTAAEQTFLTYTLAGGTLSTNRLLRITVRGTVVNTTGSAQNFRLMTRYDGTTIAGSENISIPDNVTEDYIYQVHLWAANSASAQAAMARITGVHTAASVGWVSSEPNSQNIGDFVEFNATAAKNSANPLDITLVGQMGVASANLTMSTKLIVIELV